MRSDRYNSRSPSRDRDRDRRRHRSSERKRRDYRERRSRSRRRDSRDRGRSSRRTRRSPTPSSSDSPSSRSDGSESLISSSSDSDSSPVRRWARKRRRRGGSKIVKMKGSSMEELCLQAKEKHVEGRYGGWHDYLQFLHTHGRGARPPPGMDPMKMTWKIKFNFLLSLPRKQRRGNVNRVLKKELSEKKERRRQASKQSRQSTRYTNRIQVMTPSAPAPSPQPRTTPSTVPPRVLVGNVSQAPAVPASVPPLGSIPTPAPSNEANPSTNPSTTVPSSTVKEDDSIKPQGGITTESSREGILDEEPSKESRPSADTARPPTPPYLKVM